MGQQYARCPVPNCERRVLPGKSPHGLCYKHEEWLDFLLFILPQIRKGPKTEQGLILPGSPEFNVGLRKTKSSL